jgi:hypothetical protein
MTDLLDKAKAMQARYSNTDRDKRANGRESLKAEHPDVAALIEQVEAVFGPVSGRVVKVPVDNTR